MLKDKLYTVVSIADAEDKVTAEIQLNAANDIFKGHFPTQPVLPGACMLQILKEVLETALSKKIRLKKADQMKFLSIVDPVVNETLQLNIVHSASEGEIQVTAIMSNVNGACFKFKGIFINL